MPREGSMFSRMRPNTKQYGAVVEQFRENQRANRAKDAAKFPSPEGKRAEAKKGKETKHQLEAKRKALALNLIDLSGHVEARQGSMAIEDPKEAVETYGPVLHRLTEIRNELKEEGYRKDLADTFNEIAADFPEWQGAYRKAG